MASTVPDFYNRLLLLELDLAEHLNIHHPAERLSLVLTDSDYQGSTRNWVWLTTYANLIKTDVAQPTPKMHVMVIRLIPQYWGYIRYFDIFSSRRIDRSTVFLPEDTSTFFGVTPRPHGFQAIIPFALIP